MKKTPVMILLAYLAISFCGVTFAWMSYPKDMRHASQLVFDFSRNDAEENGEEENEMVKKDTITNEVVLIGYICKKPIYRQTPFGREIADILLAVNRAYNKSDYIPCIAWGRNARFCQNMEVGTEVKIIGRVQSRIYEKQYEYVTVEERVAYEVSVSKIELPDRMEAEGQDAAESPAE